MRGRCIRRTLHPSDSFVLNLTWVARKIGQLVIGVFDEHTRDLVWYGTGEKTINQRQQSPEKSQEKLNDIVSRIMESFPPGT